MSSEPFGYDPNLPDDIREIFMWLCQDVVALQSKWSFYLELFSNKENIELFSELARASFHVIEESLRNDIIVGICRLNDPPQTKEKNLSLETLIHRLGKPNNVTELLEDFRDACKPVQRYRNKRLGHSDLDTKIKFRDNPLPGIESNRIDHIVQLAEQMLNIVLQSFVSSELFFEPVHVGGAGALIFCLKTAKEYKTNKRNIFLSNAT